MDSKKARIAAAALAVGLCSAGLGTGAESKVVYAEAYDLKLRLQIPRVYDNTQSLGYRKYQAQRIDGVMTLGYNVHGEMIDIQFSGFQNRTQKLSNGGTLTYDIFLEKDMVTPCFSAVGSNRAGKFKTATIAMYIAAEPSYIISGELSEDNSLYLMLSGKGKFDSAKDGGGLRTASGHVAGKMGCGCAFYGHKSPTRVIGKNGPIADEVSDVAAVVGTWKLKKRSQW